jgi:hypothetical protein
MTTLRKLLCATLVAATAITLSAPAAGAVGTAAPLTKTQYLAKLRAANTQAAKAETLAFGSLQAKSSTALQVKAKFVAWGKLESALGRSLAALIPPAAARKANVHLASADQALGAQLTALAARFPATKVRIFKLLLGTKLSGKTLVDRAVAELRAAGFRI